MAVTILQQPTSPNCVYTNLLYAVSSPSSSRSQYQYIMDVYSGPDLISRVRQYPNPEGSGIFDPARILNDYLEYDLNWTISDVEQPSLAVKDFSISFGESYGSSVTSSITTYSDQVQANGLEVFPGVVDPNNGISFNFQSSSIKILSDTPSGTGISSEDYHTVTVYNNGTTPTCNVNYNPGSSINYTLQPGFNTIPVGSKNIGSNNGFTNIVVTAGNESFTLIKSEDCNYDRVRFAFINNYGFWDYYGVNLPIKKNTSIRRESIEKTFVDYSSVTSQYNPSRRSLGYYQSYYKDRISVSTDWLSQTEADWLSQMIESPEVFVQSGDLMLPIVITNSSYTHNTNKRSQKTFQFEIEFEYSNQRPSR